MLDTELLGSIATQMMSGTRVEVEGKFVPVRRASSQHLKTITFSMAGREYTAIEQNPEKPGRWGQLARAGHQIVQFKDVETNRFVAVSVDGQVKEYGGHHRHGASAMSDAGHDEPCFVEHRQLERISLPRPVLIRSAVLGYADSAAVLRDISAVGAYCYTLMPLTKGDVVELFVALSDVLGTAQFCFMATVVRVEEGVTDNSLGVGFRFTGFTELNGISTA